MEKFKLKILNPRSSEMRRRFGDSLNSLFNLQTTSIPSIQDTLNSQSRNAIQSTSDTSMLLTFHQTLPTPDLHSFKRRSLVNRLKVLTKSEVKENLNSFDSDLTPVKKLSNNQHKSFVFNSCEKLPGRSWLKPRDPSSLRTSKRFWSSLEMPCQPVVRERREETPDLWSSYNSTPVSKKNDLETVNAEELDNSSFYSVDSSSFSSSFYSVQSFYSVTACQSVGNSLCTTPMREPPEVSMDCDEENKAPKRRIFKAVRK